MEPVSELASEFVDLEQAFQDLESLYVWEELEYEFDDEFEITEEVLGDLHNSL